MTEQTVAPEQERALTVHQKVDRALNDRREQILAFYGGDERVADRMRMLALHALADPKLAWKLERTDFATIIEAIRECASLGLMPIGSTAEGYLVPRKNGAKSKAQGRDVYDLTFLPGWRGLLKLTLRSPKISSVDTEVVYEADEFDFEKGTNPWLRHKRALKDRGDVVCTYAIAYFTDGPPLFEIMDEAEMSMIMGSSTSRDYETKALIGPWIDWPDEMRRKSALRRLDKRLPLEHLAERALELEAEQDRRYGGELPTGELPRAQLPATAAGRARSAFLDTPSDGAGATEGGEPAADTAGKAPEPSGAVPDGQATCGATPPEDYTGGPCTLGAQFAHGMHRNAAGETWANE
jgi:recombination protein RecT